MIISCVLLNIFDAQRIWGVPFYLSIIFFSENISEKIVTKESARHIRIKLWDMKLLKTHLWISRAKRFEHIIFHGRLLAERFVVTECQEYNWRNAKFLLTRAIILNCMDVIRIWFYSHFLNFQIVCSLERLFIFSSDYTQKYKENRE